MRRPLSAAAIFVIFGIICGRYFGYEYIALFVFLVVCLAVGHYFVYKRKLALAFPFMAVIGLILTVRAVSPSDVILEDVAQNRGFVRIEGFVDDISLTRNQNQRITLRPIAFALGANRQHHESNNAVSIRVFLSEGSAEVVLGQRIVVSGLLLELDGTRNPGGYNEFQHLRARGIEYKLFAENLQAFEISRTPMQTIRNFGLRAGKTFEEILPDWQAGIMKAMIIGDRSGLDDEISDIFRSVGIYHILIVSGLHLNILATALEKLLKILGLNEKRAGIICIFFMIIYAILTGAGIATIRATIMGIMLIIGKSARRRRDTISFLSLAAIILLFYRPLFLFEPGFIYSFSMVLGLSLGQRPMENLINLISGKFPKSKALLQNRYSKKYLPGALAAMLAYIPVNTFFFYEFSPVSLLLNFLLLPSVFFVIILGFLTLLFGMLLMPLSGLLALPLSGLLEIYDLAARGTLRLPYSVILTGRPQPLQMIFMIFAIIGICCILNRENFKRDLRIFGIFLAVGFAANFAVATVENQYVNITFLDIGQGDSAVIRRGRQAVIIDGGGAFGRAIGENVGIFTLVPYLNYRGIVRVPAIVSHNDSDHAIGIIEAINAGRISELFIAYAAIDEEDSIYRELISAAEQSGISVRHLSAGDLLEVFGVSFSVLHPKADTHFRGNDASLIIRTVYGNTSVLFTGDIESAGERALLENFSGNLEVDILKIAHHGSRTSTTSEFLERANPSLAIISAGRDNMYGHPHPSVLERLRDGGISYLVTADVGAVLMRTDGQEISIRVMSREITGRR